MSSQDQTDRRDRSRFVRQQWIPTGSRSVQSPSDSISSHRISGIRSNNNGSRNSSEQLQIAGSRIYSRQGQRDALQFEVPASSNLSRRREKGASSVEEGEVSVKRRHFVDEGERLKKRKTIFTDLTCACGKTSIPLSCQHLCFAPRPCGHPSSHICHFGDCPPCTVPVAKKCVGHEVLMNMPCASKAIQCSKPCGKMMRCGIHACGRDCHAPPCDSFCGQICGAPIRNRKHKCTAPCHPSAPCPASRFVVHKTITCSCGRISATVTCDSDAPQQRKLACDDECAEAERRRVLDDDASDINQPNLDSLRGIFRRLPEWALSVEERFMHLVLGKHSPNFVHVFRRMGKDKTDAVRLIAERWKLTVTDAGSFMVVHATAKSKAPARTIIANGSAGLNPSLYNSRIDMDPRRVVALSDMSSDSDISTLASRFGGEFEHVWLNDKNAVAVFYDPGRAAAAMRRVDHGSVYRGVSVVQRSSSTAGGRGSGSNPSVQARRFRA